MKKAKEIGFWVTIFVMGLCILDYVVCLFKFGILKNGYGIALVASAFAAIVLFIIAGLSHNKTINNIVVGLTMVAFVIFIVSLGYTVYRFILIRWPVCILFLLLIGFLAAIDN